MAKTVGNSGAHYDPADFCIPAQDHQGHSERLWCRVQPLHDRQVDVVLRSKNWPFRTKGDVMRWCIVRGLKVLENMENNVKGFMQQADAINAALRDEIYQQEFMGMFDMLNRVVQQHIAMGAQGEAVRLLAETKYKIDQMDGEPFWKKKCLDTLKDRFGHLMGSSKPAAFGAAVGGNGSGQLTVPYTPFQLSGGNDTDGE